MLDRVLYKGIHSVESCLSYYQYFYIIMNKLFFPLASLLLAVAITAGSSVPAYAIDSSKVSISPVTFNLTANAGDTLKEVIKVRNDAPITQVLAISAENFVAVGEEGKVGLTVDSTTFSLAKWIFFDKSNYTLKSGEEAQVPFSIRVPNSAEPGGHYASVYAQVSPNSAGESTGSSIGQKIGSLLLLRVAGDIKESAAIATFQEEQAGPDKPVVFNIRAKNTGTVHIHPQGFVAVTDIFGKKVADVQVVDQNVFPGSIRHMTATWAKPPFIGRFTANVLMYYGQNNQQLTASETFWIIPWKALVTWGVVALVVLILLVLARKRIGRSIKALISGK
jgi:hypothetical protein